jgi:hypothetical protein
MWHREVREPFVDWVKRAVEGQRHIERVVAQIRPAGWGDAYAREAVHDTTSRIKASG